MATVREQVVRDGASVVEHMILGGASITMSTSTSTHIVAGLL